MFYPLLKSISEINCFPLRKKIFLFVSWTFNLQYSINREINDIYFLFFKYCFHFIHQIDAFRPFNYKRYHLFYCPYFCPPSHVNRYHPSERYKGSEKRGSGTRERERGTLLVDNSVLDERQSSFIIMTRN